MYKKIAIPIDNSSISNSCIDMGASLAQKFGSQLIGSHVYAANLHYKRFTDLEDGLPEKYKEEKELQRQRDLHDVLIGKGLEMISSSYLDVFKEKCETAGVSFESKLIEGKNYEEIVKDVKGSDYDLVMLGITGLGAVNGNLIGSVCERVVRRVSPDVFVVKNSRPIEGKIVVPLDGSSTSLHAVSIATTLGKTFGVPVELVSAFDPEYHRVAFKGIADVLSEEAGNIFKFSEQEQLHEEIIDTGMAKLYKTHLEEALEMFKDSGAKITITLLEGKPYYSILKHIENDMPSLIVVGRTGIHNTGDLDIGSTTENLLRLVDCNLIIASDDKSKSNDPALLNRGGAKKMAPKMFGGSKNSVTDKEFNLKEVSWDEEAKTRVGKIPYFIRGMIIKQIERYAKEKGCANITSEIVDQVKDSWGDKMGMSH
ncbi:MAG: universal stress protein [Candidatus Anammoxibacter sp.]